MGGLVRARTRGRGHDELAGAAQRAAPQLFPASATAVGRRTPSRRLLRRPVVDAASNRDDGEGLEFSGGTIPVLCARLDPAGRAAALRRTQWRAADHRSHASRPPPLRELDRPDRDGTDPAPWKAVRLALRAAGAAPFGPGIRGDGMTLDMRFGAALHEGGVTFRLWAPAAKQVEVMLDRAHPMQRSAADWHELTVPGLRAGALYKYRIDGEIEVPDPASHFQPRDVGGPSEVIDHEQFEWRSREWRGRPWQDAVMLELHVGSFTPGGTFRSAIERLDDVLDAGISAIELMPIADFAG